MKFKIITFGCKVNSYESESLKERLLEEGYQEAKKEEDADYFFVNTCAVTNEAEKKDLKKVRSLGRNYPNARIVIMGCSSQLHKERYTSLPQVDVVIGNSKKGMVEQCLESKTNDLVDLDSRHFHYEDTPTKLSRLREEIQEVERENPFYKKQKISSLLASKSLSSEESILVLTMIQKTIAMI